MLQADVVQFLDQMKLALVGLQAGVQFVQAIRLGRPQEQLIPSRQAVGTLPGVARGLHGGLPRLDVTEQHGDLLRVGKALVQPVP